MSEREQLEQAIAALEAQRALLGDAVVEAGLAPMQARLAALHSVAPAEEQRKQATILFADVSGFTALGSTVDAEDLATQMNVLWQTLDRAITAQGGRIDKHIGDAVMAVWGVDGAREDDPARAIRAALDMQAALVAFHAAEMPPPTVRIGVNTGLVRLGTVGTTGEYTAMGDAVNLAKRLEEVAPPGGILISHDTYRHVRGLFDVDVLAPVMVKGKAELQLVYLVRRSKPRSFFLGSREVEGVETRMIGREAELLQLGRF